jgi:hypothetical protein
MDREPVPFLLEALNENSAAQPDPPMEAAGAWTSVLLFELPLNSESCISIQDGAFWDADSAANWNAAT